MSKHIFSYISGDQRPPEDMERLKAMWPDVQILDDSSPRRMLVEVAEQDIAAISAAMPGWRITQARTMSPAIPHPESLGPWQSRGRG